MSDMIFLESFYDLTTEDLHHARLVACENATSVQEAREFLEMLGLLPC